MIGTLARRIAFMAAASHFLLMDSAFAFPEAALTNAIAQARVILQREIAPKVPGVSVSVAVDGILAWSEGFGYADVSNKIPVTTATRFRIGSVSKPLTAAGLALLVEKGKIDLDAPIQKYLPDFPVKPEGAITTRLLAGHLSGIRNYADGEALNFREYPHLGDGLKIFENDPLIAPPGTKFAYASYNWNTIGVIMEAAAHQDFLHYMDEAVLGPLQLTNTVPDRAGTPDTRRAEFYETQPDGKFIPAPRVNLSFVWPAGGYLSTMEDLARFGSAMLQPGLLNADSLRLLFTPQTTLDGKSTHYGMGWFVVKPVYYHTGDSVGGTAILLLVPAKRTVVAIACNRGHLGVTLENGRYKKAAFPESLTFKREVIAAQIAKLFAPLSNKSTPSSPVK